MMNKVAGMENTSLINGGQKFGIKGWKTADRALTDFF